MIPPCAKPARIAIMIRIKILRRHIDKGKEYSRTRATGKRMAENAVPTRSRLNASCGRFIVCEEPNIVDLVYELTLVELGKATEKNTRPERGGDDFPEGRTGQV